MKKESFAMSFKREFDLSFNELGVFYVLMLNRDKDYAKKHKRIVCRITYTEIAEKAGLSRPAVNNCFMRMKSKNVILLDGNTKVLTKEAMDFVKNNYPHLETLFGKK